LSLSGLFSCGDYIHRSPPVSFLRTARSIKPTSGLFPESREEQGMSDSETGDGSTALGRLRTVSDVKPHGNGRYDAHHLLPQSTTSGCGKGCPLCAEDPHHRVYWEEDPSSIRSFIQFFREEPSNSAQRGTLFVTPLGAGRPLFASGP